MAAKTVKQLLAAYLRKPQNPAATAEIIARKDEVAQTLCALLDEFPEIDRMALYTMVPLWLESKGNAILQARLQREKSERCRQIIQSMLGRI